MADHNERERSVLRQDPFLARVGTFTGMGLAVRGSVTFFVFLWFLYHAMPGHREFTTSVDIVLYYALPASLAILFFASLRLAPIHKLRLLTVCAAITASMYAVELFLASTNDTQIEPVMSRVAALRDKKQYAADLSRQFGSPVDSRSPKEVLADLRRDGVDAIPIVTSSNHLFINQPDGSIKSTIRIDGREVIPLASVSNRITLLCNETGQWIDYRSDSRGFNNPGEVWNSGRLDIAALGDSFAHGYCVPAEKNFVSLIRQRDTATLNLGIAGNGPLLMLASLKEYLPVLHPKIVLWFYYEGNDLTDLQTERRSALLRSYLKDDFTQHDLARQDDIDGAIMAEMPRLAALDQENLRRRASRTVLLYRVMTFAKLTFLRERLGLVYKSESDIEMAADLRRSNTNVFGEILRQAKTRVEGWGGQLYFVYLPEWARYTRYSSWGKTSRNEVLTIVSSLGIPLIDIDPVFQAHGDPLSLFPFRGVGHYTETGHRLVAEEVLRRLALDSQTGSY